MRFRCIFQPVAKHHFTAYSLKCIIPSGCDSPWKSILFLVLLLRTSKTALLMSDLISQQKSPKPVWDISSPPRSSTDFFLWLPLCVHVHVSTHSLWCEDQSVKAPKEFSCSCSAKILSPMYPDTNRSNTSLQTPTVKSWMCVVQEELQPETLEWVHVVQD